MTYHILNGDALLNQFPNIEGTIIICRECMIDGPIQGKDESVFFDHRAQFIADYFDTSEENYNDKCLKELFKMDLITSDDEINLWFEDDLFCQSNLWFIIHMLCTRGLNKISLVRPNHNGWMGFGSMNTTALKEVYDSRISIGSQSSQHFSELWKAYQHENISQMKEMALYLRAIVPRLPQVIKAHADRNRGSISEGRPEKALRALKEKGFKDFGEVFNWFSENEGIYGYGDLQIEKMWDRIK